MKGGFPRANAVKFRLPEHHGVNMLANVCAIDASCGRSRP